MPKNRSKTSKKRRSSGSGRGRGKLRSVTSGFWVVHRAPLNAAIADGGRENGADVLLVIDGNSGLILTTDVLMMSMGQEAVVEVLHGLLVKQPGAPPARLVVPNHALAAFLAMEPSLPMEVVEGDFPLAEAILDELRQHLAGAAPDARSYLAHASESLVAEFFGAAAELYRSSPWSRIPFEEQLVAIEVDGAEPMMAVAMGRAGDSYGVVFYASLDSYRRFQEMALLGGPPDLSAMGEFRSLNFDSAADFDPALLREIREQPWEVAGPSAYPYVLACEDEGPGLSTHPDDLELVAVAARALARFVLAHESLFEEAGPEPLAEVYRIAFGGREHEVLVRAPPAEYPWPREFAEEIAPDGLPVVPGVAMEVLTAAASLSCTDVIQSFLDEAEVGAATLRKYKGFFETLIGFLDKQGEEFLAAFFPLDPAPYFVPGPLLADRFSLGLVFQLFPAYLFEVFPRIEDRVTILRSAGGTTRAWAQWLGDNGHLPPSAAQALNDLGLEAGRELKRLVDD